MVEAPALPREEPRRQRAGRSSQLIYATDESGKTYVDGARKRPYTPAAWDELDDDCLSGDALRLLLLIRRHCDDRESDGTIAENSIRAIAVEHGIGRKRLKSALDLLVRREHILRVLGAQGITWRDAHFAQVCFTAHERAVRREQWARAKRTQRGGLSRDDEE